MNRFKDINPLIKKEKISGWGRRKSVTSKLLSFKNNDQFINLLKGKKFQPMIMRGLGRSYGDAAQLEDKYVVQADFSKDIRISDNAATVGANVSIEELLKVIVPLGYFLPVSPGSAKVTVGGALAADAHGKNHHKIGSFGDHVLSIIIIDGKGEIQELKPNLEKSQIKNEYFWATVGGMGLTGVILKITISLIRIETSFMKVKNFICEDLSSLMDLMRSKDKEFSYSVAWIDTIHKKARGILTCGEHALKKEVKIQTEDFLVYDPRALFSVPNLIPNGILNKVSIQAFNEIWFRKLKVKAKSIEAISQFFYPLDAVENWNRLYGSEGFYQYQFVVPENHSDFIFETIHLLKESSCYGFLAVLKRFGNRNNAFLSFPDSGWTLAVDLPGSNKNLIKVLEELDNKLASLGGKLYLAKDSRQSSEMFKRTYKYYPEWRKIKSEMDPYNIFQSDLSRRLKI